MQVSQRGDFFGNVGQQVYTIDQFMTLHSYGSVINVTQTSTSPDGFSKAYKVDCQVADTSIGAAEFMFIRHKIEAQNLQQLAYGTSGAKSITLSFYVRSNVTGTYAICLQQKDNGSKQVNGTYTINSANTWERKTFTFAGDTSGVINNDNGHGLDILWTLVAGSNRTSGSARPTWTAHADADESFGHTANILSSTSNDWLITGVQLEVGDTATTFEHRSYGEELRRCYRYFQRRTSSDNYQWVSLVAFYSGSEIHGFFDHYETMRASPTLSADTGSNTLAVQRAGGYVAWSTGIIKNGGNNNVTYFYRDGVSLGTSGQCGRVLTWTSGCTISLSAEL